LRTSNYLNTYTLAICILLAIVVFSPGPGATRGGAALHDIAHAPAFACVALLSLALFKHLQWGRLASQYMAAFGLAVALGLATEIAQRIARGDASVLDLVSDAVGAFAACAIFAGFDERIPRRALRVAAAVVGVAMLVLHSIPFARVGLAYVHRNQEFPVLFDAKDARSDRFLLPTSSTIRYTTLPAELSRAPREPALLVKLAPGAYPGIAFEEPYPDWSKHERFMLDIANPNDVRMDVLLRVLDRRHNWRHDDRFNRTLQIAPRTRATVGIPLKDIEHSPATRLLDLKEIADVRIFTGEHDAGREFFVTRMWLE
jgi:hypothetical protein